MTVAPTRPTASTPSQVPGRPLSRRLLLGGTVGAALAGSLPLTAHAAPAGADRYPFTLGVASGDPGPGRITLWTRLALDPYAEDGFGGMPNRVVPVQWQLATDENFRKVVRDGHVLARPEDGHSVHLDLEGLGDREYWYRFRIGRNISPVGRTLTTPATGRSRPLHMIHVSCSHYEGGLFTAYGHAADERPDLVLGLGDYIYEGAGNPKAFRTHPGSTCVSLADYRRRYSWYKAEPELQRLHAIAPWMITWDDHEIQDNWAGLHPKNGVPTQAWQERKIAAVKAYWENMPLRASMAPRASSIDLYRRGSWGDLVDLHMLDTRQYRDLQACHDGGKTWWFTDCAEQADPARTILGQAQEDWLANGLRTSSATWQVIPQSVFFAKRDNAAGPATTLSSDGWDGYRADRDTVTAALASRTESNALVLTGDVHVHFANELKADFYNPDSRTLGAELVTTSITSGGDGSDTANGADTVLAENPHIRYIANRRGYVSTTISQSHAESRFRTIPAVTVPNAPVSTDATFVVPRGGDEVIRG